MRQESYGFLCIITLVYIYYLESKDYDLCNAFDLHSLREDIRTIQLRIDGKIKLKIYFHLEIAYVYSRNFSGFNRERTSEGCGVESFGLCVFSFLKQPRRRSNSKFPVHYDSKETFSLSFRTISTYFKGHPLKEAIISPAPFSKSNQQTRRASSS